MSRAQENQHFQILLESQSEFYWDSSFSRASDSIKVSRTYLITALALLAALTLLVPAANGGSAPLMPELFIAQFVGLFFSFGLVLPFLLAIPTVIILVRATLEVEKVIPWVNGNRGSYWLESICWTLLSIACLGAGGVCFYLRNQNLVTAAQAKYDEIRRQSVPSRSSKTENSSIAMFSRSTSTSVDGLINYEALLNEVLIAKGSSMQAKNFHKDEILYAWVNGIAPVEFLSMPERPRLSEADFRRSRAIPFPRRQNQDKKIDLVFEDLKYLCAYYKELQEVLEQKGSKMVATDYHEDEVRHAWAHGVSPQKFLSMAVRPRLDDSTCRIKFPALDYSFTPSGIETPSSHDVSSVISVADDSAALEPIESTSVDDLSGMDGPGTEPPSLEAESGHLVIVAARLRDVETLFEQGLISQEERERKRAAILGDL